MVDDISHDILIGTEKIYWVFVPIYNDAPSQLEWFLSYYVDVSVDTKSYDMSQFKYIIYNWDLSLWVELDRTGHIGFNGDSSNDPYFGQMTEQSFYGKKDTDVADYISNGGLVYVGLNFNIATSAIESEIHNNGGVETYAARNAILSTSYNSVIVR